MPISTHLVTRVEYDKMKDPPGGRFELRHGEAVFVPYPLGPHVVAQQNLVGELMDRAGGQGRVVKVMPYCPLPEYEVWGADVAYVSNAQWSSWDRDDWLPGSPVLIIEVLSPSDTKAEMTDKRETAFQGGCEEFWVVNTTNKTVQTWTASGETATYSEADSIPLGIMDAEPLPVSSIFCED
jgi:Uma2 family endonuclease